MLRLTRIREREDGAIATIVAMLFFFGVMLALGALTVDVGNINADRRQLQNGADAVALAVAQQCAKDGTCDPNPNSADLQALANANAADGYTTISRVDGGTPAICGYADDGSLTPCPSTWVTGSSMTNLQECPSDPTGDVNYVRVYTQTTLNAGGQHLLPYFFGAAVTGLNGANQQACAAVAWGQTSLTASVPLTLSTCEWERATANGTYYGPKPSGDSPFYGGTGQEPWPDAARTPPDSTLPPDPLPTNGQEVVIYLQGHPPYHGYDSGCPTGSSNEHDAPGSFGWVDSVSCNVTISDDNWVKTDSGGDTPNACKSVMDAYWKHITFLPVFDCATLGPQTGPIPDPLLTPDWCNTGQGSNTYYHIAGWARFYVSGFNLPSDAKASPVSGNVPCSGGDRCISGWFLDGLVPAPVTTTTPDSNFGVMGFQLIN